jgi:hypothetical protein
MKRVLTLLLALGVPVAACAESDESVLLQMHRDVLRYHVENDLDAWMETESENYVSANRGEISHPTHE